MSDIIISIVSIVSVILLIVTTMLIYELYRYFKIKNEKEFDSNSKIEHKNQVQTKSVSRKEKSDD